MSVYAFSQDLMASHHSTLTFPSVDVDTLGLLIDRVDLHARRRKYDTIYGSLRDFSGYQTLLSQRRRG